jgi:hypothetical protein
VDARTDIFSFGAVLYEMITGRRAFAGDSILSILSSILRDEPKPAAEIAHGLPRELDRVVKRCLQKDPNRRYQHAGDLKIDLEQVKEELAGGDPAPRASPERPGVGRWWWVAAAAACVAGAFAVGWRVHGMQAELPPWRLTHLTADAGLSGGPALSPDGKVVAYSSDRGLDGEPDLYIKQVAGGQPIRLTLDGAGNRSPDFSPDGSKIVFRSNRDGGGIYEMPAFGRRSPATRAGWFESQVFAGRLASGLLGWCGKRSGIGARQRHGLGGAGGRRPAAAGRAEFHRRPLSCLVPGREASSVHRLRVGEGLRKVQGRLVAGRHGWGGSGKDRRVRCASPHRTEDRAFWRGSPRHSQARMLVGREHGNFLN